MLIFRRNFASQYTVGDYFRVLIDEAGIPGVLDEMSKLTQKEQLETIVAAYAAVRDGELFLMSILRSVVPI